MIDLDLLFPPFWVIHAVRTTPWLKSHPRMIQNATVSGRMPSVLSLKSMDGLTDIPQ
jgi:hypothetical protein